MVCGFYSSILMFANAGTEKSELHVWKWENEENSIKYF